IIMEVNPNIAYGLIDRILGGKGTSLNKVDSFTEIETILLTQLFEKAVSSLEEAWSSIIKIDAILEDFEANPQFLQMVAPNESVVVVTLNTTIGEASGMINICIPHIVLEPIIPKLSFRYQMQSVQNKFDSETYEKNYKNLLHADVEGKAILGETTISINQFLHLTKEDIITLNQSSADPLLIKIDDENKYDVQRGKYKNRDSVQVLKDCEEGDEHGEGGNAFPRGD